MTEPARRSDIGMLAAQLMRALQEELFERLAERGHPDVRPRHGSVLAFLEPEGLRATELSARSGQHKQVVGTIVDELVALGYASRQPDPDDRRAKRIVPTGHGLDEIRTARAILADTEQRLEQRLGAERFASFRTLLEEVTRLQRDWRAASS